MRLGRITRAVAQDAATIDSGREFHDKPLTVRLAAFSWRSAPCERIGSLWVRGRSFGDVLRGERYSDATVQPGTAMTVKEMRPAVATRQAFLTSSGGRVENFCTLHAVSNRAGTPFV